MKALKIALLLMLPFSFIIGGLLALERPEKPEEKPLEEPPVEINEVAVLLDYLSGKDLHLYKENMEEALSVTATEVFENLGNKKYHIVDLRNPEDFYPSHIPGSVLVEQALIYDYLRSIPLDYIDKVVLVCYAGQRASYVTGLIRLLGIEDVYFLRWGMSAWEYAIARDNWLRNMSNNFANRLVSPMEAPSVPGELPLIFTFKTTGAEILNARVTELLQEDFANARIRADELMADPLQFQIVVSDPLANQDAIMAPEGSIWLPFIEKSELGNQLAALLPFNPIVITSVNGQSGGLIAAFLRTLGYDARFLTSGLSSLAINSLRNWDYQVFSLEEIKNFNTSASEPPVKAEAPRRAVAGC
ncbi:MAG TPA: rhodanese-like domain-containing protein [Bacteroidales bacterium]|nr:rhodanese-like domain-containing protein [Bacteroidales bacterium]